MEKVQNMNINEKSSQNLCFREYPNSQSNINEIYFTPSEKDIFPQSLPSLSKNESIPITELASNVGNEGHSFKRPRKRTKARIAKRKIAKKNARQRKKFAYREAILQRLQAYRDADNLPPHQSIQVKFDRDVKNSGVSIPIGDSTTDTILAFPEKSIASKENIKHSSNTCDILNRSFENLPKVHNEECETLTRQSFSQGYLMENVNMNINKKYDQTISFSKSPDLQPNTNIKNFIYEKKDILSQSLPLSSKEGWRAIIPAVASRNVRSERYSLMTHCIRSEPTILKRKGPRPRGRSAKIKPKQQEKLVMPDNTTETVIILSDSNDNEMDNANIFARRSPHMLIEQEVCDGETKRLMTKTPIQDNTADTVVTLRERSIVSHENVNSSSNSCDIAYRTFKDLAHLQNENQKRVARVECITDTNGFKLPVNVPPNLSVMQDFGRDSKQSRMSVPVQDNTKNTEVTIPKLSMASQENINHTHNPFDIIYSTLEEQETTRLSANPYNLSDRIFKAKENINHSRNSVDRTFGDFSEIQNENCEAMKRVASNNDMNDFYPFVSNPAHLSFMQEGREYKRPKMITPLQDNTSLTFSELARISNKNHTRNQSDTNCYSNFAVVSQLHNEANPAHSSIMQESRHYKRPMSTPLQDSTSLTFSELARISEKNYIRNPSDASQRNFAGVSQPQNEASGCALSMPIQENKTYTVPFNDLPRVSMENINLLRNQCDMVYSTSLVLPLVQNEKFKAVKTIASGNLTKIANLLVSMPPYMSVEREDFKKNDDRLKFNRPEQDTTSDTELTLPVVSRVSRNDSEISLCHSLDLPQERKNEFIASKKVVGEIVNRSLSIPPHLSNKDFRREACREGKSTSLASASGQTKIARKPQVLSKRDLQIVFRSVRRGGTIRFEEASALRKHIVEEMKKAMNNSRTELRFRKSGIVDPGWFLVTADDEISRDWLLTEYHPSPINGICFSAFTQKAAQRLVRIGFELRNRDINITKVIELLKIQNRQLNIDSWHFLQKERSKTGCFLTFGVDKEDLRRLKTARWTLYYELFTLKVRKLSS